MHARRQYHLTLSAVIYVAVMALLAVGAVNSQNNLIFVALGLAIAGLLISGLVSGSMLMGLEVEREMPPTGRVGEPFRVRYLVRSRNLFVPAFALTIIELEPRPARGRERAKRDHRDWRKFFFKMVAFVPHVAPRGTAMAETVVIPHKRGELELIAFRVESCFPFGIVRKSIIFENVSRTIILPAAIDPASNISAGQADGGEITALVLGRLGRSSEYVGVREYVPGDSRQTIAWRASARRGELVVREMSAPSAKRVEIVLLLSAPTAGEGLGMSADAVEAEESGEQAISIAAGWIERVAIAGRTVELIVPAAGVHAIAAPTGVGSRGAPVAPLLTELALIKLNDLDVHRGDFDAGVSKGRERIIIDASQLNGQAAERSREGIAGQAFSETKRMRSSNEKKDAVAAAGRTPS